MAAVAGHNGTTNPPNPTSVLYTHFPSLNIADELLESTSVAQLGPYSLGDTMELTAWPGQELGRANKA